MGFAAWRLSGAGRCIIRTEVEFVRKYVLKRILISIVILFFVSFIIYGLMRCLPTSYIERMAQQKAMAPGSKSYEEWLASWKRCII